MPATHASHRKEKNFNCNQWCLRRAIRDDISDIVEIHRLAFHDHFLTLLGPRFLRAYYEVVHTFREGILLVSVGTGGVDGFVAGFMRPHEFYERMLGRWWQFGVPMTLALARRPDLVGRVLQSLWRLHRAAPQTSPSACELSSVAVRPLTSGKGVGKQLVNAFLELAWTMGSDRVYLTTDADRNDGANFFYARLGFRLHRTFQQRGGRFMNEYVIRPSSGDDSDKPVATEGFEA